jgi:chemotaxis protein CheX
MNSANAPAAAATAGHDIEEKWPPLVEMAGKEVFERMLGARLQRVAERPAGMLDMTAMVGLAGELCGVFSICCSRDTAARMAALMLGTQPAAGSQEARDAFGEVCNMTAGNFKNKIAGTGENCMLSVPTVITGSDYSLSSVANSQTFELIFLFEGKPLTIVLDLHN